MPVKGKCWSCGEEAFLTGMLLRHLGDGHLEFHMVCKRCEAYFEWKGKQEENEDEL